MRRSFCFLALVFWLPVNAQDWALINPAYKYNYSNDGSDTISNQIYTSNLDTLAADSVVMMLNPVVGACSTTDTDFVFLIDLDSPQFLMRQCAINGGVWTFSDTATYAVRKDAFVGESWAFRVDDSISATMISIDVGTVLGEPDSIKTLASALGDTVLWSKAHGIVRWHLSGNPSYDLIGIQGPNIGHLIPGLSDFYPYQTGDVVQYSSGNGYGGNSQQLISQYQISGRTDYVDSIVFTATRLWAHQPFGSFYWIYGSDNTSLRVKVMHNLMNAVNSYPGQLVRHATFPSEAMIAKHGMNDDGYYEIRNAVDVPYTTLTLIDIWNEPDSACAMVVALGSSSTCWIMDEQVGLRRYIVDQGFQGHSLVWQGALIGGVQIGTLGSADFFHVGMPEERSLIDISLHPNPARDVLHLDCGTCKGTYWITDAQGRRLQMGYIDPNNAEITVAGLLPGAYYFCLEEQRRAPFVILR